MASEGFSEFPGKQTLDDSSACLSFAMALYKEAFSRLAIDMRQ